MVTMTDTLFRFLEDHHEQTCAPQGIPRLQRPNRQQLELRPSDLESLIAADDPVRAVWEFVEGLDLSPLYANIRAVEGHVGRTPVDPAIHMALWLYATLDGVGSARALARLCERHDVYRWICGGVSVNHHSLADFRVAHEELLDDLLTQSVASLMAEEAVDMRRVAQDGVRVRASAGAASFRRKKTLEQCLEEATEQVKALRQELDEDPGATSRRQRAARERAARERQKRVCKALAHVPEVEAKKKAKDKTKARVSTTDAEARVMKMADGGFRPAYNGQFAVDTKTQVIVGVDVSNSGSDHDKMPPMVEQLDERYGHIPDEMLVDGGFASHEAIEAVSRRETACTVYAPVPKPKDKERAPHVPLARDGEAVASWRVRMGTAYAKAIYKERASTVECVNAIARNRGLQRFLVRGQRKVKAVLLWFALAHNLMRAIALRAALASAPA
jgi:transposase